MFAVISKPAAATATRRSAARSGFTLVELLVALAVAGVVLALGVPSFRSTITANRLSSTANEFVSAIQFARSEAIRTNGRVMLCRSTDGSTCAVGVAWTKWVVGPDANKDGVLDSKLRAGDVKPGITVKSNAALANNAIVFRSDGLARTAAGALQAGVITVCIPTTQPKENVREISIGSGSRISIRPLDGGGACN